MVLRGLDVFNFLKHVFDPSFGIYTMKAAGNEERIKACRTLSAFVGTCKQIIFAPNDHRANAALHRIIINFDVVARGVTMNLFL